MNKRLIILFACLAVVVVIVILATVVFSVRNIEVLIPDQWEEQFDKAKIVSSSKIKLNTSIFAVSEKKAIANIEKSVPYAKVVTIERVFPSTIRINIVRRDPILAVVLGESSQYALLDRELKVLEIVDGSSLASDNITVINGYKYTGETADLTGNILAPIDEMKYVKELIAACESMDIINGKLPIFADSFDVSRDGYIIIRTVKGINISIMTNSNLSIANQFRSMYTYFLTTENKHDKSKYIVITNDGIKIINEDEYYKVI